jgi:GNAT superfamily N-acetyltransferase
VQVRRATIDDVPEIAAAYLQAWRAGYEGLLSAAELDVEAARRAGQDWESAVTGSDGVVIVAERSRDIVGVAHCETVPQPGHPPWLHLLYVVPAAWGTGIATALLDEATDAMRRAGHRSACLRVVEAQGRARRFYEREGWTLDPVLAPGSNGLFRLLHYRRDL